MAMKFPQINDAINDYQPTVDGSEIQNNHLLDGAEKPL